MPVICNLPQSGHKVIPPYGCKIIVQNLDGYYIGLECSLYHESELLDSKEFPSSKTITFDDVLQPGSYSVRVEFRTKIYSSNFTITAEEILSKSEKEVVLNLPAIKGSQILTSSGTFTVPEDVYSIDVCCIGGGQNGGSGGYHKDLPGSRLVDVDGGAGGSGGKVANKFSIQVNPGDSFNIIIGNAGQNTSFSDIISSSEGVSSSGGSGGHLYVAEGNSPSQLANSGGGTGSSGQYAFNDSSFDGIRYGAGGGGGGAAWRRSDDNNTDIFSTDVGEGGTYGGGRGGWARYRPNDGSSATSNTGSGGGGGGTRYTASYSNGSNASGGSGSNGLCIVRWGY